MESAIPMLIFLGGLLGFGFLIMICVQQSVDMERADAAAREQEQAAVATGKVALRQEEAPAPQIEAIDAPLLERLRAHVLAERRSVRSFVSAPSRHTLLTFRPSEGVEGLLQQVQEFLRCEQRAVHDYLASPSAERLHRVPAAVAAA